MMFLSVNITYKHFCKILKTKHFDKITADIQLGNAQDYIFILHLLFILKD